MKWKLLAKYYKLKNECESYLDRWRNMNEVGLDIPEWLDKKLWNITSKVSELEDRIRNNK